MYLKLQKDKKTCWKVLTKGGRGDIMYKLSAGKPEASEKSQKVFWKNFQKSIDKESIVWYTRWAVFERGQRLDLEN